MSASTGVMNSLMVKLANLKEEKKVRKETNSLKGELSTMEALLFKVATRDDPDVQAKEWTRQVREVGYDTEDCIDIYVQQRSAPAPDSKPPKLFRRLLDRRSSAKTPEFAEEITELTTVSKTPTRGTRGTSWRIWGPTTPLKPMNMDPTAPSSLPS